MLFQNSLGIEISENHIALVHLKTSIKGIRLAGHEICTLDRSLTIDQRLAEASKVVNSYIERFKMSSPDIYIGVPSDMAIQRIIFLPSVVKENLVQSLKYELDRYVPVAADETYLDCQILSEDREQQRLKILLVVVKREALEPYIAFGQKVADGIGGIEINATAMTNRLSNFTEISGKENYLYFYQENESCELGFLKKGKLHHTRTFSVDPTAHNMHGAVRKELIYLKENFNIAEDDVTIGIKDGGIDSNAVKALETNKNTELQVSRLPVSDLPNPKLSVAFGLALKGLKKVSMQINLLPSAMRKKPSRLGHYLMFSLIGMIVIVATMWGGSNVLQRKMTLKQVDIKLIALRAEALKVSKLQDEVGGLEKQIEQMVEIRQKNISALDTLKELTELIPKTAWLHEINIMGENIQISGLAKSASGLVELLESSPMFQDVVFLSAITKDKEGHDKFRIGLKYE